MKKSEDIINEIIITINELRDQPFQPNIIIMHPEQYELLLSYERFCQHREANRKLPKDTQLSFDFMDK